jgi:hypothetical protein
MMSPDDGRDARADGTPQARAGKRMIPGRRTWARFMSDPTSPRKAIEVIVFPYLLTVLFSAVLM